MGVGTPGDQGGVSYEIRAAEVQSAPFVTAFA
jgi:hypothetical protein